MSVQRNQEMKKHEADFESAFILKIFSFRPLIVCARCQEIFIIELNDVLLQKANTSEFHSRNLAELNDLHIHAGRQALFDSSPCAGFAWVRE